MMEFHISRDARERYQFAESLFSFTGNVVFANLGACREFTQRINQVREVEKHPDLAVHAGALYAMGLIDEASHVLIARYRERFDPETMTGALGWFSERVGSEALDKLLLGFVEHFPGISVTRGMETPEQWLAGETDGTSHRAAAMEELLLLWIANRNEAFQPFEELFEEKTLAEKTVYRQVAELLPAYFATRPLIPLPGSNPVTLLELLRAPALASPRSLREQLALIRLLWKPLLGESLERLLLLGGEILHEEELAIWMQFHPPGAGRRGKQQWPAAAGPSEVPTFGDPAHEYEKFSPDTAWMPTAVLIAKSTYVWLAQLSRQYGRRIARLDDIPDEELATLARRGLNSLWLIGVWERSRASKTIKQLCGNRDAVASAYSLFDYSIAEDLGGKAAYTNLRDRAYRHGVRLASDMVPNHMGIDSPWVIEHPDWFISRPDAPYPAYSFNGPDLSHDGRVEIKIEDHYFEQSDAAVVFRRRDRASGETRYIYHGNDGTSFPWNDTAQLDYLNPAAREQVIQTILHVARLFPVIRFDAAMTLAKRHFHRLWFPGPGASGAIPSRAEYGMSQAEFDRLMPKEFWREVVDRVAAEVPGTLLLAEAFWLMEGYFVRTLGMHRVYNSAFMNMMRDEENAKYRSVIKNTLEFDPDIMKRYVNFMSNPDERTAIDQFGKGDKCFGVAAMMATLPGLPMFGHGQIEGFSEKYGMEYQWPRYEESADRWLVERHEREIAPLLHRRWLFAESSNFLLYDFFRASGSVDENVFAYSNRKGGERALVVYNNRYGTAHGTIDYSAAYADKGAGQLKQQRLREGLGVTEDSSFVLAFRDSLTGLNTSTVLVYLVQFACASTVCGLARAGVADIERCAEAIRPAKRGRIHTFISTSPSAPRPHPAHDARRRCIEPITGSVTLARNLCGDVEWSAQDATRTERDVLRRCVEAAIRAGASTINIPDTVGYTYPSEYARDLPRPDRERAGRRRGDLLRPLPQRPGPGGGQQPRRRAGRRAAGGVRHQRHRRAGRQRRAGRDRHGPARCAATACPSPPRIDTQHITRASRYVSAITGFPVQFNKAIVGKNAFAHEAGIHQDGMLKNAETYEIMQPEDVGPGRLQPGDGQALRPPRLPREAEGAWATTSARTPSTRPSAASRTWPTRRRTSSTTTSSPWSTTPWPGAPTASRSSACG